MASSRPIIAPERSRRGRKYTVPPLAINAHLCYTPVIAYDFCRERLPGEMCIRDRYTVVVEVVRELSRALHEDAAVKARNPRCRLLQRAAGGRARCV